jgi:uncharacterized HAD superfamily protein
MRLGFDLDDVVFDTAKVVEDFVANNYGIEWSPECSLVGYFNLPACVFHNDEDLDRRIKEDLQEMFDAGAFVDTSELIEDAHNVLHKFKRSGHSLHFISSRPKQFQPATYKFLRMNRIPFDTIDLLGKSEPKGFLGRKYNLDMFVDDVQDNLASMYQYKKKWRKGLLLLDRPWNSDYIDGSKFIRMKNWKEILRHVGVVNR